MILIKKWEEIIIHHSLTKDSNTVSWNAIRTYHMHHLRWAAIGYHWGVELVGGFYEVLQGRNMQWNGAHARGYNKTAIGICCVGNYDDEEPSEGLIVSVTQLVTWLISIYNIPKERVRGHADISHKTCPGKLFDLRRIRERLPLP